MANSTDSNKPRARARTTRQLERQDRVFKRSVIDGVSYRQIAEEFGISTDTIVKDVRAEEERRSDEIGDRREAEKARACAIYEHIILEGLRLAKKADEAVEFGGEGVRPAGVATPYASLARGLDSAVRARERIDKILGIDAPMKIDAGMETLLRALDGRYEG